MKDKGVWGDPESEGSSKQTLGADVQKVDIRLKREGNRAMDWESPNVIRNPSSKSASTGRMSGTLPREISPTVASATICPEMEREGKREVSRGHIRYRHEPT